MLSLQKYRWAVVGLGATGISCAKYLATQGVDFFAVDSRHNPPCLNKVRKMFPHSELFTGVKDGSLLKKADAMVVSPGIPLDHPMIVEALNAGVMLLSDIDLFCQSIKKPVVGVTGSNGKSTVTQLIGEMAKACDINVAVAGNIGVPVLDLLNRSPKDLYILELSSFQLERVCCLRPAIAVMLNISPDHLDVHHIMQKYIAAKHRIYEHCDIAVYNQEDKQTWADNSLKIKCCPFTAKAPKEGQFGLIKSAGKWFLAKGSDLLLPVNEMKMKGWHNALNALAALTAGKQLGFSLVKMLDTLTKFPGLPHRCQWVARKYGADWFNDSKGTNEGASIAAIEGLAFSEKKGLILIAGGDGKGANFKKFATAINKHVRKVVLYGKDACKIEKAIGGVTSVVNVNTLEEAVAIAKENVLPEERVLLSPACTSWDMFPDYQVRGNLFIEQVRKLSG